VAAAGGAGAGAGAGAGRQKRRGGSVYYRKAWGEAQVGSGEFPLEEEFIEEEDKENEWEDVDRDVSEELDKDDFRAVGTPVAACPQQVIHSANGGGGVEVPTSATSRRRSSSIFCALYNVSSLSPFLSQTPNHIYIFIYPCPLSSGLRLFLPVLPYLLRATLILLTSNFHKFHSINIYFLRSMKD
jgi:hypothetical protein